MRRRDLRHLGLGLLTSLLLHGAFLLWVVRQPSRADTLAPAPPAFVFVEVEPPSPPPPPPPPPAEPPSRVPRPVQVRAATPAPAPMPVPGAAPSPVERAVDVPRLAARPSLLPSPSAVVLPADAGVAVEVVTRPTVRTYASPQAMVEDTARSALARGKVDRGLAHPYFVELGRSLISQWDADRVVAQGGLTAYGQQFAQNSRLFADIWTDRAQAFARTGSPLDSAPAAGRRAPLNDRLPGLPGVDLEARRALRKEVREQFRATRRATLKVVQDPSGRLLRVELVEPSSDAKVDREALEDVRAAAQKLPPPPPEALAGRAQLTSLWSFELIVSISPPVPTFSFEFDEALGVIDARMPLDRRIYKKVRLLAVE